MPSAVGGIACLALSSPNIGTTTLGGYTILMALVQVRLIPLYRQLRFGPGFWAFTSSYAATASYAIDCLARDRPPGHEAYAVVVLAITGFIASIAARSLSALALAVRARPCAAPPPSPARTDT